MDIKNFANLWINSWNSHNLEDILSHYADDIEITTPMIKTFTSGEDTLKGKEAVREYWGRALEKVPDLHFKLYDVTYGINSVALYYQSIMNKKAIEVMFFNDEGKVKRMHAFYTD